MLLTSLLAYGWFGACVLLFALCALAPLIGGDSDG